MCLEKLLKVFKWKRTKRSEKSKTSWWKKIINYRPNRQRVAPAPAKPLHRTKRMFDIATSIESPAGAASGSPETSSQDLETIVYEFENGFVSPSKHDDAMNQMNYVKKIVAVLEGKFKSSNDLQCSSQEITPEGTPKWRSAVCTPSRNSSGGSHDQQSGKKIEITENREENSPAEATRSRISACLKQVEEQDATPFISYFSLRKKPDAYVSPYRICFGDEEFDDSSGVDEDETKLNKTGFTYSASTLTRDKPDDSKSHKKTGTLLSFGRRGSKDASSESCTSPIRSSRHDYGSRSFNFFKSDKEEFRNRSTTYTVGPVTSSPHDAKTVEGVDLKKTDDLVETISIDSHEDPKTSTMIDDEQDFQAVPQLDKTPKIVGAFLKKPIEVEDTFIDWIPAIGKRLPRKKSLKKLLHSWTKKKHDTKSKLSASETNLYEEPHQELCQELCHEPRQEPRKDSRQDSGFYEKSSSSSSLASFTPITVASMQQQNAHEEFERRRPTMKTFCPKKSVTEEKTSSDAYDPARTPRRRRLLLYEVPREELKLELGPAYPPLNLVTMTLGRKIEPTKPCDPAPVILKPLPKHPQLSTISKHPFVSLTKFDELDEVHECCKNQEPSIVIKNDLYEVEFRRSCDDICASCRSLSPAVSNYDVPRRFLSKSDTQISLIGSSISFSKCKETIYDVPKTRPIERPRSSVLEEAQALRRKCVQHGDHIYAVPRDLKIRYAAVDPMI